MPQYIAEILLKLALNTNQSGNQSEFGFYRKICFFQIKTCTFCIELFMLILMFD